MATAKRRAAPKRKPATKKRSSARNSGAAKSLPVPGIAAWDTYAGGTGAARGKYSYGFRPFVGVPSNASYSISPISHTSRWSAGSRHAGYQLTAFGIPDGTFHTWIDPDGTAAHGPVDLFRSPQAAAKAAREHWAKHRTDTTP